MDMNLNATAPHKATSYTPEKSLTKFLELITSIVPIAYIFQCTPTAPGTRLIIVLDQYRFQRSEETKNILSFLDLSQMKIEIIYYHYGIINDMLQQGNLFLAEHLNANYCIYKHATAEQFPQYAANQLNELKTSSRLLIKNAIEKATNFFDGASLYYTQGELQLAAFMLHQTCEQTLRLIIRLYNGKDFKSHQLVLLQKTAGFFYPAVRNIFHPRDNKELQWLAILQQAYVGARYDDAYEIDPEHFLFLQSKVHLMLNKIDEELIFTTS